MRVTSILGVLFATLIVIEALPIFEVGRTKLQITNKKNFVIKILHFTILANDKDRQGNQCPLFSQYNVQCPILCVKSYDLCPPRLAPKCPEGQEYCLDGTCQTLCDSSIMNACLCNDPSSSPSYVPCAANQIINITYFNPQIKDIQTRDLCAANASIPNVSNTIGIWGYPNGTTSDLVWTQCPAPPPAEFTFKEPMWIAVWVIAALEVFILLSWQIYKYFREMKFKRETRQVIATSNLDPVINEKLASIDPNHSSRNNEKQRNIMQDVNKSTTSENTSETVSFQESERLTFKGFKRDYFGLFGLGSVAIITLLFIVFLGCLVGDYCK